MPRSGFSSTNLNRLRRQLYAWRRCQAGRTPLPEAVWESAIALARTQGVSAVARMLRLDYYKLRERLKHTVSSPARLSGFVEVAPPALPVLSGRSCTVEFSDERGGKMRVHLPELAPALLAMAQAFWRRPR